MFRIAYILFRIKNVFRQDQISQVINTGRE